MPLLQQKIRDCQEIARRSLALFGVVGIALGAPRNDIVDWLKDEALWDELSPAELSYVLAEEPTEKQTINATWRSEALIVLLWALGKVGTLPAANEQYDTILFQDLLPPFTDLTAAEFISHAHCRPDEELEQMAGELMHFHWEARHAPLNSEPLPPHVDIEIIQERHHAINWIIGAGGLPWDEVTTDT